MLILESRFGLNGADVLENVAYTRAYNTDHQSRLLMEAASMMIETRRVQLVVLGLHVNYMLLCEHIANISMLYFLSVVH
jgi:hypothetical protein